LLGVRQCVKRRPARRIGFEVREHFVGVIAAHLGLPIALKNFEDAVAIARVHLCG
jgi:hypothetical protein